MLCGGGLLVASAFFSGAFRYYSVCRVCGETKTTSEFQVWGLKVWQTDEKKGSRLSAMTTSKGIVGPHHHDWLFGQGAGNGVKCAIGSGRHIVQSVDSHQLASFVFDAWRFGQPGVATNLLVIALNPKLAHDARSLVPSYPEAGFSTRDEFLAWRNENESNWEWRTEILSKEERAPFVRNSVANERP